ncbi:hypothetical protein [Halobaculum lipolyticum]|uniref:Uncharacterized protein n=1 Tax=Halobaculum lipolyticum TaxID=3032001 RepID=A0ABD5W523_9EURY|nr:hypothetical protein [Halobaculum sp. DT31]
MSRSLVVRLGAACERYGPGRLPRAADPDVGAGYACATSALLSCVVFAAATTLVLFSDGGPVTGGVALAALAAPLVVPSAFLAGYVSWRGLSGRFERTPRFGAAAGVVATALTYPLSAVGFAAVAFVLDRRSGIEQPVLDALVGTVAGSFAVAFVALVLTCWATFPLGASGGYVYERVRRERTG